MGKRKGGDQMIRKCSLFLTLLLIASSFTFWPVQPTYSAAEGIVNISGSHLNVRSTPSTTENNVVGRLTNGAKVEIIEQQGDWYSIKFNNGKAFVAAQFIQTRNTSAPTSRAKTKIVVNGETLNLPFEPPLQDQRLLVPFRVIGEALGIQVHWAAATRQVIAKDKDKEIVFTIGDSNTIVNNQRLQVTPAPQIVQSTTLLPLRFFSETFGADVQWNQQEQTVTINRLNDNPPIGHVPAPEQSVKGRYSGTVITETLNVRKGPGQNFDSIGRLRQGDQVEVLEFSERWAKIRYQNSEAFVHTLYLDLFEQNNKVKILGQPKINIQDKRTTVSWSKIGGTLDTSHQTNGNRVEIKTSATSIDKVEQILTGVDFIEYDKKTDGYVITLQLDGNFQAQVSHTVGELTLTVSPKGESKGIKGKKIVVDPGHGGTDPGAVSNGIQEKELVLDIGLRVQKLLEEAGAEVIMTRTTDVFITLDERVRIANQNNANSFVSIHANASGETAHGTETYWNNSHSSKESKELAEVIQKKMIEKLGTRDRGVKEARFQVIRQSTMPSVLVEVGFITNKDEAKKMQTDDFRKKAAEAIFEGIVEYYK